MLKDRLAGTSSNAPIKDEILKQREKLKVYQFNQQLGLEN